jgi:hypothetical protein
MIDVSLSELNNKGTASGVHQWDLSQQIDLSGTDVTDCIVQWVYDTLPPGTTTDNRSFSLRSGDDDFADGGIVDIPDVALMQTGEITGYIYYNGTETIGSIVVNPIPREQPADYVSPDNTVTLQDLIETAVGTALDEDLPAAVAATPHNNLASKQGGTTGQYYHLTSEQVSALHTHSNLSVLNGLTAPEGRLLLNTVPVSNISTGSELPISGSVGQIFVLNIPDASPKVYAWDNNDNSWKEIGGLSGGSNTVVYDVDDLPSGEAGNTAVVISKKYVSEGVYGQIFFEEHPIITHDTMAFYDEIIGIIQGYTEGFAGMPLTPPFAVFFVGDDILFYTTSQDMAAFGFSSFVVTNNWVKVITVDGSPSEYIVFGNTGFTELPDITDITIHKTQYYQDFQFIYELSPDLYICNGTAWIKKTQDTNIPLYQYSVQLIADSVNLHTTSGNVQFALPAGNLSHKATFILWVNVSNIGDAITFDNQVHWENGIPHTFSDLATHLVEGNFNPIDNLWALKCTKFSFLEVQG